MLVDFLKGISLSKLMSVILIGLICWVPFFFSPINISFDYAIPLIRDFLPDYLNSHAYYGNIMVIMLVGIQSLYIIRLNYKYILLNQRTYLPALISTLLSIFFSINQNIIGILTINLFWMFCIDILFNQTGTKLNLKSYFKIGILLAISSFFFWPAAILIPIVWFISFSINSQNLRGLFSVLIGFFVIWLFYFYISYFIDDTTSITAFFSGLINHRDINETNINLVVFICPLLFILMGLISTLSSLRKQKIIIRKYYLSFLLFFLIIPIVSIWLYFIPFIFIYLIIVPASFFGTHYLLYSKNKWIKNIVFLIFLGGIAIFWIFKLSMM